MVRALARLVRPPEVWLVYEGFVLIGPPEGGVVENCIIAMTEGVEEIGPFETVEQVREHADDVEGIIGRRIVLEDLR